MPKTALILGVTGQDGSYLAELLISKGYTVHGIIRRSSSFNTDRIDHLYKDPHESQNLFLHYGDMLDSNSLINIINKTQPDEIYNLAAMSHVRISFDQPVFTADITGTGTVRLLEAIRQSIGCEKVRFYQASSSEMFGAAPPPQNELTPFKPRSPYGCAKIYAHYQTINYREAFGLFACCGILFNHESERRGETFVTRKITRAATRIALGLQDKLYLGNLDARRDWSYAPEVVHMMWKMLQQPTPDDYVIGTGETHSVREFVELTFKYLNLDWAKYVFTDERYKRPTEVEVLCADSSKAHSILDWTPQVKFKELVERMVKSDLKLANKELIEKNLR